jgi:hypothetical protein
VAKRRAREGSEGGALEEAAAAASLEVLQAAKAKLPLARELLKAHPAAFEELALALGRV